MNISKSFIDRPVLASVLSVVIFVAGIIAMFMLPISEYPEVVPPSVVVQASFPGANPKVIAETVATPLEEQINGVERMLYMSSQATTDGNLAITVTFELGTDPNLAQQLVENRVSQALPRLPEIVRQQGVTTVKSSPDLTMVVHLTSPDRRYDTLYLRNYAVINVKDVLARISGVGQIRLFGSGEYAMRIWLKPDRLAELNLSPVDVTNAVREQNVQVAAGVIGGPPNAADVEVQLPITTTGRLQSEQEFRDIIVRSKPDGSVVRLGDVARIELGASQYALVSTLSNQPAVAIPVFQAPGSNALEISTKVRETMEELKKSFPEGMDYQVAYDPTVFVRESIQAVVHTLIEAIALVVLVVIVFLQSWRASIIPLLAVPVSIVGTFALMYMFGFSINALSLFGLVLAIGIVVDDAIVVVENVERNIHDGLSPKEATYKAMSEVSGPIISIALTLCAVFVPIAFISGLTGQFYKQFALTIAISTIISAFNSLTLSPALSAMLLRDPHAKKDALTRWMDRWFGWFFSRFNRIFDSGSRSYGTTVTRALGRRGILLGVYLLFLFLTGGLFYQIPSGFVPVQDKQYLVSFAALPDGTPLRRTEEVITKMSEIALAEEGVQSAVAFPGLSINGFVNSPNAGIIFVTLKPFDERRRSDLSGFAISEKLQAKFAKVNEAFIAIFPPPPVQGLGSIGGFKLQVEDRTDKGYEALHEVMQKVMTAANQRPELGGVFSSYKINSPQLFADVDRTRAKQLGVRLDELFSTMQIYLGSIYINDFNQFGRTYQVIAQADSQYRARPSDVARIKVKSTTGDMIPLGSLMDIKESYGPESATRYNAYRSADLNGMAAPGYSSGQAQRAITEILAAELPNGMSFEWTELTLQQVLAGNTALLVFPLCVLLVFCVLAAQYESVVLPIAIILIVPMGLFSAMTGVWLTGGDNNIFTQIGLFVLVGLACKNAILIVEFARELEHRGESLVEAATNAARLRLRPVLMTSIAFIMGVLPLVRSTGAGSEMRHAMGVAVFAGMIGVTLFGLMLTPVFYVVLRSLENRLKGTRESRREVTKSWSENSRGAGIAAAIALLTLQGCSSAIPFQSSELGLPDAWKTVGAAELSSTGKPEDKEAWWRSFNDKALNVLLETALLNNRDRQVALARVDEARADRRGVAARLYPQLAIGGSASSGDQGFSTNFTKINVAQAALEATWELDLSGRIQKQLAASSADAEAREELAQSVGLSLIGETARGYFEYRGFFRQVDVARRNLAIQEQTLRLVEVRERNASASEFDVERARSQVETTRAQLASLEGELGRLENRLSHLIGGMPGSALSILQSSNGTLAPVSVGALAPVPAAVVERRPDIRAAERQFAASIARREAALREWWPKVTLLGLFGVQGGSLQSATPWAYGANLAQPLLNWGKISSLVDSADAAQRGAFLEYQGSILSALEDVETSLVMYLKEQERNEALRKAFASDQSAVRLARLRYEAGTSDLLEVLTVERNLLQSESDLAVSDHLVRQRVVSLHIATGGGADFVKTHQSTVQPS